jgi:hypothetical protein
MMPFSFGSDGVGRKVENDQIELTPLDRLWLWPLPNVSQLLFDQPDSRRFLVQFLLQLKEVLAVWVGPFLWDWLNLGEATPDFFAADFPFCEHSH